MVGRVTSAFAVVFGTILGAGALSAQEAALGEAIFMDRCSVCHGATGEGDGLVGELFDRKPRNLRTLAADNNGQFPFSEVYQAIDGRRQIAGHGLEHMPIWGEYFMDVAIDDPRIDPKDARLYTQGRILAVVYYLQSIQTQ